MEITDIGGTILDPNNELKPQFLKVSKLQSIKTKIIVFALLATIAPTLILGLMSYLQNSSLLRDKISHELRNATDQSAKELDLWLKERLYDLRVFSSSYIISENLPKMLIREPSDIETAVILDHLKVFLKSVSDKFSIYEELSLLDRSGELVVTSAEDPAAITVPTPWKGQLQSVPMVSLKPRFQPYIHNGSILIAEGINSSTATLLGVLITRIDLGAVRDMLKMRCTGGIDEIYLTDSNGKLLVSSTPLDQAQATLSAPGPSEKGPSTVPSDYIGHHDRAVIGISKPVEAMGWTMVAEMDKKSAYAEIVRLRRITIALVGGLILFIGLCAYFIGHTMVSPLRRLARGAALVAGGDLDVDIPVTGLSEVSYLTQVFNHMVASLKRGREEISAAHNSLIETNEVLHQISITDSLTGLHNRKHIMDLFSQEMARSIRYGHSVAILMIDIDYFKKINDTYGHQTGDRVLSQLARSLMESARECDYVGRYGGEEFLIVLPHSNIESGAALAERIRHNTSKLQIPAGGNQISVTTSIGVAAYPDGGSDVESIIREADDALYKAKAGGRNCIVISEGKEAGNAFPEKEAKAPNLKLVRRSR